MDMLEDFIRRFSAVSMCEQDEIPDCGAYALILSVSGSVCIDSAKHRGAELRPGNYLYAGRASKNLPHRLVRHKKKSKPLRWHIDRLTSHSNARLTDALILPNQPESECEIIRVCLESYGAFAPLPGFGSSDCKELCPAHLIRLP